MNNEPQIIRALRITGTGSSMGGAFSVVRITGEGAVNGSLQCARMTVIGQTAIDGNIHSQIVKVQGDLSVTGDCTAETFQARGAIHIGGLLNAGETELLLHGPSQAVEIGGSQIRVRRSRFSNPDVASLNVDAVEGDVVRVEYTHAKVVRGHHVEVGRGCHIDLVEYYQEFRQAPQAVVKDSRHIG